MSEPEPIGQILRQGFITNLLNPKIALFFMAFLPQFVDPASGPIWAQMLLFGGLFNLGGFVWILVLAWTFGTLGSWLSMRPGIWRWQRWFTGGTLFALAAHLAFSKD